jgi:hypothetical protein
LERREGIGEGAFGWYRSGINMRQSLTIQLWIEWIILWSLMKIIINYFREQEGQCKWKSHIYPIPIDDKRVEVWKINLDTLQRSSPILFLKSNLNMRNKNNKHILFLTSGCLKLTGADIWQLVLECAINWVPQVCLLILWEGVRVPGCC